MLQIPFGSVNVLTGETGTNANAVLAEFGTLHLGKSVGMYESEFIYLSILCRLGCHPKRGRVPE